MNYITTTQLRTKSVDLIKSLLNGEEVNLVHRSKLVGVIKPKTEDSKSLSKSDILEIIKLSKNLKLSHLSDEKIDKKYRKHIVEKYGKGLS